MYRYFRHIKKSLFVLMLFALSAQAAVRIMPLGDSITYDARYADDDHPRPVGKRSGYRNYLWYKLKDVNYSVDFVGSQIAGQDIIPPFDPDNEGHPGWTSYDIAEHAYDYMVNSRPDIVLLHIGTNDRSSTDPQGVADILDEIDYYEENYNTHVKAFVALIIDRKEHDGRIPIFNRRLKEMLQQRISHGDDIVIVDMYHDAGLRVSDYADNTHPNNNGYYRMANVWFNVLMRHKESNSSLRTFPSSIVPTSYIVSVIYDDAENTVTFTTKIPDNGIQF